MGRIAIFGTADYYPYNESRLYIYVDLFGFF
jgi:hypothetical protein